MREKQCKYVNVFVYSFYLFFLILAFFLHLLMRHLWFVTCGPSLLGRGVFFGPSAGATLLNNATQKARETFATTFDIMGDERWCCTDSGL